MHRSHTLVLLSALPAVIASFAVLTLGEVGRGTWLIHLLAISLAGIVVIIGSYSISKTRASFPPITIIALALLSIASPLLYDSTAPNRWAHFGPISLYMTPMVIPSFLVALSVCVRESAEKEIIAFVATITVAALLAAQPDASQVLALLMGLTTAITYSRPLRSALILGTVALIALWTFFQPDPLEPIPYVEGVFALAFNHSMFAGVSVAAGAIVLIAGLFTYSLSGPFWLAGVATYYSGLFVCSVAGLTPAPLIGYGAGPLFGYALMAVVSLWVAKRKLPYKSARMG